MSHDDDYSKTSLQGGALTTAMRVSSALTICGCLAVVFVYTAHESIRQKNINKVVFYICMCQIGGAVGTMIGQPRNGSAECYTQALLTNFFPFAYTLWTSVTAYMLYRVIHRLTPLDIFSPYIQGLCWGVPLVLTLLPLTTDTFGNEDSNRGWCFYKSVKASPEWTVTFWVAANYSVLCVSVFLSILFISMSLYKVYGLAKNVSDHAIMTKLSHNVSRFIWYPVISFFCWLPESIYDVNDSLDKGQSATLQNDTTFIYFAILLPILEGLFVTIAYFTTSSDAREMMLLSLSCKPAPSQSVGQPTVQFNYSSDPEDYESRDTIAMEETLSSTKPALNPFHLKPGRTSADGVEMNQYHY